MKVEAVVRDAHATSPASMGGDDDVRSDSTCVTATVGEGVTVRFGQQLVGQDAIRVCKLFSDNGGLYVGTLMSDPETNFRWFSTSNNNTELYTGVKRIPVWVSERTKLHEVSRFGSATQ